METQQRTSIPEVYVKHLVCDGAIPVVDSVARATKPGVQERAVLFRKPELEIQALIAAGRIRPIWGRGRVRQLRWVGQHLEAETPVAQSPLRSTHDIRFRTRYSHKHETPQNPPNVWTFLPLDPWTRAVFLAVVLECYSR